MKSFLFILLSLWCPALAFSVHSNIQCRSNYIRDKVLVRGGDDGGESIDISESIEGPGEDRRNAFSVNAPTLSYLSSLGSFYAKWLEKRPIMTKSITAAFIFGLSDFIAQKLEASSTNSDEDVKSTNLKRLMASVIVGFAYFGPAAHAWYSMIFRVLPATTLFSTLQKAALGQLFFGPSFTCIFFASALLQSGTFSIRNWAAKIRNDLPGAWVAGAGFWPLVDLVSYSMIAPQWIPLFVNVCSLVWTIYLSLVANQSKS
mmetsp:Transcript_15651/g.23708  ORF Transcript_15651/g.23708 Transcript_15651/m.23708 type:complete len:259 (-) Transcript_15651:1025-1801(-)